jgi:hypothetical protein
MYNERLPAARRLYGFRRQESWEKHVNECFSLYMDRLGKTDATPCPDPEYSITYKSNKRLWCHLQDAHSYPPRNHRLKTQKERDIFVDRGFLPTQRKRYRTRLVQEATYSELVPAADAKPDWSMPTVPTSHDSDSEASTSPSTTNTTLSSIFDVESLQEDCPSVTSVSSPSLSFADDESLLVNEHVVLPPCSPPSSTDSDSRSSAEGGTSYFEDASLSLIRHDMLRMPLDESGDGSAFVTRPLWSQIPDPASQMDTLEAQGDQDVPQGQRTHASLQLTSPLSAVPIDPELRFVEHMEGVVTESHPVEERSGGDMEIPLPTAIDEEEDVWEVESLLAKWGRERGLRYLVKWKGFKDESNTWEPPKNIHDALVADFNTRYSEDGGNHLGVELLDKRICRGAVQYFVRWRGRPESENSWENGETISYVRRREFEARPGRNESESWVKEMYRVRR